jgi:haloacid dehalogenase-like hydrolase
MTAGPTAAPAAPCCAGCCAHRYANCPWPAATAAVLRRIRRTCSRRCSLRSITALSNTPAAAAAAPTAAVQDKADLLAALQAGGARVAMVGDGINDAAAMAHAAVGVAVGQASALTRGAADVVLLRDSLYGVVEAHDAAVRARTVVYQNIVGTIAVDVIGAALAGSGYLGPVESSLAHGAWDVIFILNSG